MKIMETDKQHCVLVTGGRGFIGRSVSKLLQRHRYRVISIDVTPASMGLAEVAGDITDSAELDGLVQQECIAAIIHLAAVLPTAAQREPLIATKVNIQGSVNLLEMARRFGVRRFLFASSLSIYGTCPAEGVVTEMDRAAPEDLYGAAKLYVEQLGEAYRHTHGLEFVSLRIGRVVGAGARSTTSAWRSEIFECLEKASPAEIEIPYADSERILLVHVEDLAKMFLHLLQAPQPSHSVYNAGCESVIVGKLKSEIERLNSRLGVKLGGHAVVGNPGRVDWSRFAGEFGFRSVPIFERLASAAGGHG
jgi:nucleoside-diphosphate-sugar epimerase